MGRLKRLAKKGAKKAAKKGITAVKATPPVRIAKQTMRKFMQGGGAMEDDRLEELEKANAKLVKDNAKLETRVEELKAEAQDRPETEVEAKNKWSRGTLPGNKYIKIDHATGKFEEIDKQEWDSLA